MARLLLTLLKWQVLIKLRNICDFLQLVCVTLNLLLQVFNSLRDTLRNLEVVLHLLHRSTNLCLLQRVLCQRLVGVLQLTNLFFLQVDPCHFPMIIGKLLIIIVIRRLLVLFKLIYRFLVFFLAVISA